MPCRRVLSAAWRRVNRRKHVDIEDTSTKLKRCLTLKQLVFIGVGKTVGVGIYVLIGVATKEMAGPAVILAFLVAFVATLMNALCFAEFASRTPKTGAQYTYMYDTIGEGVAFIVGWTNILGITAAFSMAARGWSGYFDSLFDHAIQNFTISHIAHWSAGPPFPSYPDVLAVCAVVVVMVIACVGVNISTVVNLVLAAVSASCLIFVIVCGFIYGSTDNWFHQEGGFFPFGIGGVLKASAACFYAFQGFEVLGYSSEETVDPKKTIPRAIACMLCIVTTLYLGVAMSFTLMVPYKLVNTNAPFPGAFELHSVTWAKRIVGIGPTLALFNLCILELFTVQRLSYSMSADGLLLKYMSRINKRTKVPIGPVLTFGPIVLILAVSVDLSNLLGFMVIYSFIQYSLFSAYMITLRYETHREMCNNSNIEYSLLTNDTANSDKEIDIDNAEDIVDDTRTGEAYREQAFDNVHNDTTSAVGTLEAETFCSRGWLRRRFSVKRMVYIIYVCSFMQALMLVLGIKLLEEMNIAALVFTSVLGVCILLFSLMIWFQEQKGDKRGYQVPLMPFLPVCCMMLNHVMLVSAADTMSLAYSVTLAAIGGVIYLVIVMVDVIKHPDACWEDVRTHAVTEEEHGLLSNVNGEIELSVGITECGPENVE